MADEKLERLLKSLQERSEVARKARQYLEGRPPLPDGAADVREAYKRFQRFARSNYADLIVSAVTDRMVVNGFRTAGGPGDDARVRAAWRRSRMRVGSRDVHRDMVGAGRGYVAVDLTERGAAFRPLRPEQTAVKSDPMFPGESLEAVRWWREGGVEVADLHERGRVRRFTRDAGDGRPRDLLDGWRLVDAWETGLDFVPIFELANPRGQSDIVPHFDLLDRINWGILQRLTVIAMQTFIQRALKPQGAGEVLPTHDEDGNEIDYEELLAAAPGAIWTLPGGVDIWESKTVDIRPALDAHKADITDLAVVTQTPVFMLLPDGANQSAKGSDAVMAGLEAKVSERRDRAGWGLIAGAVLALEDGDGQLRDDVTTEWRPSQLMSLAEQADAASKAADLPWRERMTRIYGLDGDTVDRLESERANDLMMAALAGGAAPSEAP